MIQRDTGRLRLHDRELGPGTSLPGGPVFALDTFDGRDRPLAVIGRIVDGRLARLELTYPVRTAVHYVGAEPDWEATRKGLHDAIVREWFANSVHDLLYGLPPEPGPAPVTFRFGWGTVRSIHENGRAAIEVVYTGDEA